MSTSEAEVDAAQAELLGRDVLNRENVRRALEIAAAARPCCRGLAPPDECKCTTAAPAAARPVPQAGEVAEIAAWLREIGGRDPARAADLLTAQGEALAENIDAMAEAHSVIKRQLAALTAQAAEIERLKADDSVGRLRAQNDAANVRIENLEAALAAKDAEIASTDSLLFDAISRAQELEAALQPFAEMANTMDHCRVKATVVLISGESDGRFGQWPVLTFRRARAALAPAGKEKDNAAQKTE